jgi:hypothetical protein
MYPFKPFTMSSCPFMGRGMITFGIPVGIRTKSP